MLLSVSAVPLTETSYGVVCIVQVILPVLVAKSIGASASRVAAILNVVLVGLS